jgi:2-octaprenyl-6-methoxyphenol hydroxylase
MTSPIEVEACILGAGPVGATLAALLAAGGVRAAVVDTAPLPPMELPEFDGRAYAIALTSKRLLEAAGVWERLPEEPCPILGIRVADGRPGERASSLCLHFDHAELGEEPFGWMVEARALRVALNARLPLAPGLAVFAPATATVERGIPSARSSDLRPEGPRPRMRPAANAAKPRRPDGRRPASEGHEGETFVRSV